MSYILVVDWIQNDVPFLVKNLNDESIVSHFPSIPQPYSEFQAQLFVQAARCKATLSKMIMLVHDVNIETVGAISVGLSVGAISVRSSGEDQRTGVLGYWIDRDFRGEGYAVEAVKQYSRQLFDQGYFCRLELRMTTDNVASRRVAEKAGFVHEGVLRQWYELNGTRKDFHMFSCVRSDLGY